MAQEKQHQNPDCSKVADSPITTSWINTVKISRPDIYCSHVQSQLGTTASSQTVFGLFLREAFPLGCSSCWVCPSDTHAASSTSFTHGSGLLFSEVSSDCHTVQLNCSSSPPPQNFHILTLSSRHLCLIFL